MLQQGRVLRRWTHHVGEERCCAMNKFGELVDLCQVA